MADSMMLCSNQYALARAPYGAVLKKRAANNLLTQQNKLIHTPHFRAGRSPGKNSATFNQGKAFCRIDASPEPAKRMQDRKSKGTFNLLNKQIANRVLTSTLAATLLVLPASAGEAIEAYGTGSVYQVSGQNLECSSWLLLCCLLLSKPFIPHEWIHAGHQIVPIGALTSILSELVFLHW
jgi:hypothetical protein